MRLRNVLNTLSSYRSCTGMRLLLPTGLWSACGMYLSVSSSYRIVGRLFFVGSTMIVSSWAQKSRYLHPLADGVQLEHREAVLFRLGQKRVTAQKQRARQVLHHEDDVVPVKVQKLDELARHRHLEKDEHLLQVLLERLLALLEKRGALVADHFLRRQLVLRDAPVRHQAVVQVGEIAVPMVDRPHHLATFHQYLVIVHTIDGDDARVNNFNENFLNETDGDPNSVLIELDKGIRSSKIGDQCEAIIRFPKLFEKYPFPILINSSFLKLAEFFRIGSNLSRLWILRVCQQSEKHLEKILNIDEFLKRLFMVIHSNDPVARALTLRMLGAVAFVIAEKQHVHHAIRMALDSHDTVEVEAAIFASVQFAAQSKTFAVGMCSKVASMIESLQTPVNMKLHLIPVLRHMHHDASTAALVRALCRDLLPKYPSELFVVEIIRSLSQLSCATLVDIPDQVDLLLKYLQDPRKRVQSMVLLSLKKLAEKGAYLWPKTAISRLLQLTVQCNSQNMALDVILTLTKCPHTCHTMLNEEQQQILDVCKKCLLMENVSGDRAMTILASLITYCHTECIPPPVHVLEYLDMHLEFLIQSSLQDKASLKDFRLYLKCGVQLSKTSREFGESFAEMIAELLSEESNSSNSAGHSKLICEALGAICSNVIVSCDFYKHHPAGSTGASAGPFSSVMQHLLKKLEVLAKTGGGELDKERSNIVELLAAICMQAMLGSFMPDNVIGIFLLLLQTTNPWTQYRIARSASRYGQHFLAALIYEKLSRNISLENLHFYLLALSQISKAECILNHGQEYETLAQKHIKREPGLLAPPATDSSLSLIDRLEKAINLYCTALSTLKASSSPLHPLGFQSELIRLRCIFLEVLHSVVITRNTLCITPPSEISQTLAQNCRDPLQKYGHITNQLRKHVKLLKNCEEAYGRLYKSSFDADPGTLEHLEAVQYLCATLQLSIEAISFINPSETPKIAPQSSHPETRYLLTVCRNVTKQLLTMPTEGPGGTKMLTHEHTDMMMRQIETVVKSSHCIPRFFFQVLQNTSVKLALTPQPRATGEPVFVQPNSHLVVKVEGVIQHYGRTPSLFRAINSIQLTLNSTLMTSRPNDVKLLSDSITLTQVVKPHRDFLSGSFLIALNNTAHTFNGGPVSLGGQWQLNLETCIIDDNGVMWQTGPKSTLLVRIPEDNHKQTLGMQSAVRRF
uniref:Integrator complex subunit 7 n=1 Tax=Anopheles atroparvus TaxID=41427 RepID=A0AAG5DHT6_ANOAO